MMYNLPLTEDMVERDIFMKLVMKVDLENTNMDNESPSVNIIFTTRPYNVQLRQ